MSELLERARVFEDQGAWERAIDCYLSVNLTNCGLANPRSNKEEGSRLEEIWESAVRLGGKHSPSDRYPRVCETVAEHLRGLGRFDSAGELFLEAYMEQQAVQCYIDAQQWDKAKRIAQQYDRAGEFIPIIEAKAKEALMSKGDGDNLVAMGDVDAALDMYARQGDWGKCLALAEKQTHASHLDQQQGLALLHHYVFLNVKQLCQGDPADGTGFYQAAKVMCKYGSPAIIGNPDA